MTRWLPLLLLLAACEPGPEPPVPEVCNKGPENCADVRPIVFVHGVNGSSADWDVVVDRLIAAGWPEEFLFTFDAVRPTWGCNLDNAHAVADLVELAKDLTCQGRIDLVAHSMGTLSSRYFVKNLGGTDVVNAYTTLGGIHHGVESACDAPPGICIWDELCATGDYITQLNEAPSTPGPTHWTSIYGTADEDIPNERSHLVGADNVEMAGVDHVGLLEDEATFNELLAALQRPCW